MNLFLTSRIATKLNIEDLKQKIQTTDLNNSVEFKAILYKLISTIEQQDDYITHPVNENVNLHQKNQGKEKKVNEMERCSSKKCLLFLGVAAKEDEDPLVPFLKIINNTLRLQVNAIDIGACHFLPSSVNVKRIIIRFIYDRQREMVWNSRFNLRNNKSGNRAIFIVERLTEKYSAVMKAAEEKNLITGDVCL